MAANKNNMAICKLLIKAGADITLVNIGGYIAANLASSPELKQMLSPETEVDKLRRENAELRCKLIKYEPVSFVDGIYELNLIKDYYLSDKCELKLIHPEFKNRSGLIVYYIPTCPACIKLMPTLLELANQLNGVENIGIINCADKINGNHLLADFFNINGYPTIQFYNHVTGKYVEYFGSHNVHDIVEFIIASA